MKAPEFCPTCGAKMKDWPHTLSKGLARVIFRACQNLGDGRRFHLADLGLTYSQRCNAQKLRYWGILSKAPDDTAKGGFWILTDLGLAFAQGRVSLQKKVWTFHGEVQRFEGKKIYIGDVTGGWKYRPDYAREGVPHNPQPELPL